MKPFVLLLVALALPACASLKSHEAPSCSGPRRPANPHGTVLAPEIPAQAESAAAAGACAGAGS
jgi:hypothetical protein